MGTDLTESPTFWGRETQIQSIGEFVRGSKGVTKSNGIYFFPQARNPFGYALLMRLKSSNGTNEPCTRNLPKS